MCVFLLGEGPGKKRERGEERVNGKGEGESQEKKGHIHNRFRKQGLGSQIERSGAIIHVEIKSSVFFIISVIVSKFEIKLDRATSRKRKKNG